MCLSLFNRGRQPQLCIQLCVSLWSLFPVFLVGWILALLRAGCSFPRLQLHNCTQRSSLGWPGCNWFQQLGAWVPFPCSPSCLLCSSPRQPAGQWIVSFCTGKCALQTPQGPPFYFAYLLPHTWHCCPFPAASSSYSCHSVEDLSLCRQGHTSERQNSPSLSSD